EILNSFSLHQNYPNPFNPITNISYRLPERGNVAVKIFNANGEIIKEIIPALQEAGEQTVTWDSKNRDGLTVSSGVYFYQVQWNNTVITKKMIYLK
ncbi:MAG: T9SS type A sorting domain-containing protein, partial [Ignavibacteria bacterium]|nr:T9SS type A sorting domain-containing protein [Ignavibacteria bacterium]